MLLGLTCQAGHLARVLLLLLCETCARSQAAVTGPAVRQRNTFTPARSREVQARRRSCWAATTKSAGCTRPTGAHHYATPHASWPSACGRPGQASGSRRRSRGERLTAAERNAELAADTPEADQRQTEWQLTSDRLTRWLKEQQLDEDTVAEVSDEFLQAMEDSYTLVVHPGGDGNADTYFELRQRAAVTREWLRDQGYSVPDYPKEPGL
ncbi:hypothetical protein [Streptomyces sp. NPDC014006]|uniref:hypothetical protein n=1 Tax=Streptomyces sp. NPDC014006 TaxID=3364870 RepID=UPI0036F5F3EC